MTTTGLLCTVTDLRLAAGYSSQKYYCIQVSNSPAVTMSLHSDNYARYPAVDCAVIFLDDVTVIDRR